MRKLYLAPVRSGRLLLMSATLIIGVLAGWQLRGIALTADAAEDLDSLARAQVEHFYAATAGKAPLAEILGEGFQLIRTDGMRYDRSGYVVNPASLQTYEFDGFKATRTGDALMVTFFASVRGKIEGIQREVTRLPRLAVFTRAAGGWKLQAFANLGSGSVVDPQAEAKKAIDSWVGAVASGEKERVRRVLAPEFQIVRADGSAYGAAEYLESDLPKIAGLPATENMVATGYGDLLVTRYALTFDATIDGKTVEARAPRLTVFRRSEGAWLVVAHANFAQVKQ
ncbi:nuclear transport factor 2 family protein [Taklimakanibacter deserti]|uniref:nuclear transport factor 2 family protein n=1 Tax=Taklimakanibacter deserti TaxID=2267839 RepID=UPI000E64A5CB